MFGELVRRGPNARDNGSERDFSLVDLREAVDPGGLAARRPELVVNVGKVFNPVLKLVFENYPFSCLSQLRSPHFTNYAYLLCKILAFTVPSLLLATYMLICMTKTLWCCMLHWVVISAAIQIYLKWPTRVYYSGTVLYTVRAVHYK